MKTKRKKNQKRAANVKRKLSLSPMMSPFAVIFFVPISGQDIHFLFFFIFAFWTLFCNFFLLCFYIITKTKCRDDITIKASKVGDTQRRVNSWRWLGLHSHTHTQYGSKPKNKNREEKKEETKQSTNISNKWKIWAHLICKLEEMEIKIIAKTMLADRKKNSNFFGLIAGQKKMKLTTMNE